jgi:putative spermidine/putrescine transport system ATP-binding protein
MVFQNYALFPHLTVGENIAFGLRAKGLPRKVIDEHVARMLAVVKLDGFADRSVGALSGGQQQRISLARAMVVEPTVMLLDEPFSALDRNLREAMRIELRQILRQMNATVIFVTHDQEEALVMSDRVAVMNQGRAEQIADPLSIYSTPASPFVLGFVGQALRIQGRVASSANGKSTITTAVGLVDVPRPFSPGERVIVAVRPELVELSVGDDRHNRAELQVRELVFLGSKTQVHFVAEGEDVLIAELPGPPPDGLAPGPRVAIRWPIERTLAYHVDA